MKQPSYWAFYIAISNHMWEDELVPPRGWYLPKRYQDNNNVDFQLWDELVDFLVERKFNMLLIDLGDGVRFQSHPEIAAPDAVSIDFLRKKLDELRAKGITPIPKLNFSTSHHTWLKDYRFMVGTQKYLDVCSDLIAETCEIFDRPSLFHLGMDEEDDISAYRFRSMVSFRKEERLWHDFYHFFDVCENNGSRPWVWSDYYWNNKELFIKHMPKSVLQSNWYYYMFSNAEEGQRKRAIETFGALDELGYDQIPTGSTWNNNYNLTSLFGHCKNTIDAPLGMMTAAWAQVNRANEYTLKNDAHRFYLARQEFYPESL